MFVSYVKTYTYNPLASPNVPTAVAAPSAAGNSKVNSSSGSVTTTASPAAPLPAAVPSPVSSATTVNDSMSKAPIEKVTFYKGKTFLMTITAPPYVFDPSKLPAGTLQTGAQRITQRIYYANGTVNETSQVVTIKGRSAAIVTSTYRVAIIIGSLMAILMIGLLSYRRIKRLA